jgi:glycosyltransferase involved in cell wall biosynthesis
VPIEVVYNTFESMPSRIQEDHTPVEIGFLGGFIDWKGVGVVARWAEQLADLPVHWHVFGASGNTAWEPRLRLLSQGRLTIHGRRPPAEIYRELDLVVHPSVEFDPSPNVLMEAASAGVPVVASDAGGSPEFVRDEHTGFLFPAGSTDQGAEKVRLLVQNPALRLRMARLAIDFFDQFVAAHDSLKFYRQLLGAKRHFPRP